MKRLLLVACLLLSTVVQGAAPVRLTPELPGFAQNIGARLPLEITLRDSAGRTASLGQYFGKNPVLLVMGYYRCRNLCSLVFDDVLQAALQSGVKGYRLLGVSIDPSEGAAESAPRQSALRAAMGGDDERIMLLTGQAPAVSALAQAVGFGYRYDAASGQYQHPAGFVVVTPEGRVSRYFLGLRYDPETVRQALARAQAGGSGTLAEQVQLLCARLDQASGHGGIALATVRGVAAAGVGLMAFLLWRLRTGRSQ